MEKYLLNSYTDDYTTSQMAGMQSGMASYRNVGSLSGPDSISMAPLNMAPQNTMQNGFANKMQPVNINGMQAAMQAVNVNSAYRNTGPGLRMVPVAGTVSCGRPMPPPITDGTLPVS